MKPTGGKDDAQPPAEAPIGDSAEPVLGLGTKKKKKKKVFLLEV